MPRVSIHAPRVGRDLRGSAEIPSSYRFNPRAPRGARQAEAVIKAVAKGFNPRAPRGARRQVASPPSIRRGVSIHAPRVGRDNPCSVIPLDLATFQSTRPAWGATAETKIRAWMVWCFNPRAPRGARRSGSSGEHVFKSFQSTRPAWGATKRLPIKRLCGVVSIHAPRVGRDAELSAV